MSRGISQLNGSIVMEMSDLYKERFQIMAQFLQEVRAAAAVTAWAVGATGVAGEAGGLPPPLTPPHGRSASRCAVQLEKCQRRFHGAAASALEGAVADADRCVLPTALAGAVGWRRLQSSR